MPPSLNHRSTLTLDKAILWDFDGLGITCIEYSLMQGAYFILAQPHDSGRLCVLYRWSGVKADSPERVRQIELPSKEATTVRLAPFEGSNRLLLTGD